MAKLKRKTVFTRTEVDRYKLDGCSLEDVISYLISLQEKVDATARLDINMCESHGDYYLTMELIYYRPETDQEYDARVIKSERASASSERAATKRKIQKEKDERELLAKLKAKYE